MCDLGQVIPHHEVFSEELVATYTTVSWRSVSLCHISPTQTQTLDPSINRSSSKVSTTAGPSSPPHTLEEDGTSSTAVPSTPAKSDHTDTQPGTTQPPSRKRPRDDESDSGESVGFTFDFAEARRQRRRTESYIPAFGWALWDMVSNPINEFIEGFKHGVRNEPPSESPFRTS